MAVPGHDERTGNLRKKFNLPIVEVVKGGDVQKNHLLKIKTVQW